MRTTIGLLSIAMLAGACSSESELRYTSTLQNQTRGVALSEDGLDAHAGMIGTTCTIDTNWGCPTSDADLPSDEERVLDHFGGDTLGSSPEALHIIRGAAWQSNLDVGVANVRAAVLRTNGPLMVAGDAGNCSLHIGDSTVVAVPSEACLDGADFAFDRENSRVFVAAGGQVHHIAADHSEVIAEYGDLVAFDPQHGMVYVAQSGEVNLFGLRTNGVQVWAAETEGAISSIETRGQLGEVLAMVEGQDGYGIMERREGRTGELIDRYRLPDSSCDIEVSDNGRTVACKRAEEVNFYELEEGLVEPVIDDDPPANCIDPIARMTMD